MPLCPQIVITPITVTSTGMTQTSIIPIVAATTEEVDELQVEIDTIEIAVNGKNKIYRQATAPDGSVYPLTEGDIWFDTDDSNIQYYWTGTAWVSVRDLGIQAALTASAAAAAGAAAAEAAAAAALLTADGKNRVYRQANTPTGGTYAAGDLWFDTDADNKTSRYSAASTSSITAKQASGGTATLTTSVAHAFVPGQTVSVSGVGAPFDGSWVITATPTTTTFSFNVAGTVSFTGASGSASGAAGWYEVLYGNNSLANLSANKLTSGSIDAGVITVSNINAGNIATGVLAADRISANSITGGKLAVGTIEAVSIAAGTITGEKIAATTITAGNIAVGTITADQIAAATITSNKIGASQIESINIAAGAVTAAEIAADTITAAEIEAGSITVDRLQAGTLTAFTLQTSTGARRVTVSASTNAISFREANSVVGFIGPASISGIVMHYGSSFNAGATAYPHAYVSSGAAQIAYDSTTYVICNSTGVQLSGDVYTLAAFYNQDSSTSANAANTRMDTNGRTRRSTASSARFKEDIVNLSSVADLNPIGLLSLPIRAFKFKSNYLDPTDNRSGMLVPGLIAEEVAEHYSIAADRGDDGLVENWNERFIIPGMLALIQDLHARVETLEGNNE
jgi:hypothetical protein